MSKTPTPTSATHKKESFLSSIASSISSVVQKNSSSTINHNNKHSLKQQQNQQLEQQQQQQKLNKNPKFGLNDKQVKELKEVYNLFDKDKDGKITLKEIDMFMRTIGEEPNENYIKSLIKEIDADGTASSSNIQSTRTSGGSLKDIICFYWLKQNIEEELKELFKIFDKGGLGYINTSQLRIIMQNIDEKLTDKEIFDMIREVDTDNDGKISYSEFIEIMIGK